MHIRNIKDAKTLLGKYTKKIIGVESSAFLIYFPGKFLPNFEIIAYKDSLDIQTLKRNFKITTLDTIIPGKINHMSILNNKNIQKYMRKQNTSCIITRKETKSTEAIITDLNLQLIGNSYSIREPYENKKVFREIISSLGMNPISGQNIFIDAFLTKPYSYRKYLYGEKLVLQIPEITKGGGFGTIFINNEKQLNDFKKNIKDKIFKNKIIETINVTRYIQGISASIIACATKRGTLTNCIQTQITDIPEVISNYKGSGAFCGHDRSFKHYTKAIQRKADDIAKKLGTHMYLHGYKGIFGLDLIIDDKNKHIYVVECNSRYTGAFPMLSILDEKYGNIPMDAFHLLEHLNIHYTIDFDKIDQSYKIKKEGSHIILSNKNEENLICRRGIKAGVYTIKNGKLLYKRAGYEYKDIKTAYEFIITDGNPKKGQIIKGYKESSRICHLLFPLKILKTNLTINNFCKKIIDVIYSDFF